jgi:hypothetical protein
VPLPYSTSSCPIRLVRDNAFAVFFSFGCTICNHWAARALHCSAAAKSVSRRTITISATARRLRWRPPTQHRHVFNEASWVFCRDEPPRCRTPGSAHRLLPANRFRLRACKLSVRSHLISDVDRSLGGHRVCQRISAFARQNGRQFAVRPQRPYFHQLSSAFTSVWVVGRSASAPSMLRTSGSTRRVFLADWASELIQPAILENVG